MVFHLSSSSTLIYYLIFKKVYPIFSSRVFVGSVATKITSGSGGMVELNESVFVLGTQGSQDKFRTVKDIHKTFCQ